MLRAYRPIMLLALLVPCWVIAIKYNIDLTVLHNAAELTHTDLSRIYAYNGSLGRYFYGPFSLVLISPLGAISYDAAKFIWIVLQTASFFLLWISLYRLYPKLKETNFHWGWWIVFIFSINPIHNNFQSNNIQLMLAAALFWAELYSRAPEKWKQLLAGALVAFCGAIKVFPFFVGVLYLAIKSRYVRSGFLLGCLFSLIAPMIVFGPTATEKLFLDFFQGLSTYDAENSLVKVEDILCFPSLMARFFGETQSVATITRVLSLGMAGIYFLYAFVQNRKNSSWIQHRDVWALGLFVMTFINPSTRPHYFMFYLPAFASVVSHIDSFKAQWKLAALLISSWLLIAFTAQGVWGRPINDYLESQSIPTYGMILIGAAILWVVIKNVKNPLLKGSA